MFCIYAWRGPQLIADSNFLPDVATVSIVKLLGASQTLTDAAVKQIEKKKKNTVPVMLSEVYSGRLKFKTTKEAEERLKKWAFILANGQRANKMEVEAGAQSLPRLGQPC